MGRTTRTGRRPCADRPAITLLGGDRRATDQGRPVMSVQTTAVPASTTPRTAATALAPAVAALSGLAMLVAGVWAVGWPTEFAELVLFPANEHFAHDAGAFAI